MKLDSNRPAEVGTELKYSFFSFHRKTDTTFSFPQRKITLSEEGGKE